MYKGKKTIKDDTNSPWRWEYSFDLFQREAVKQPNQLTAFTNELNASNLVNRITILRRVVEKKVLKVNLPYAIHGNYGLYGSWYCENGNQLPYEPELAKLYSQDKLEYCLTCFTSSNKLKFAIIA
ncbi:hypothetical protein GLOIN_2v1470479 [Rhizophagus irregularis DAOM 181602=DAOM 197198]|nr:hypothetical protein GLOIN_2v1470479 [Rhizophagus irregularis DAOM 181602=DAOM 197198]